METISSDLRSTTPQSQRARNVRRADPIRVLIDKDRLARFWFLAAITVLVGAAVERIHLARTLKERERVVIVDPAGTFFVSPVLQFQEAKQLHAEQSTLAAVAFLERNPKGFDPTCSSRCFSNMRKRRRMQNGRLKNRSSKRSSCIRKPRSGRSTFSKHAVTLSLLR